MEEIWVDIKGYEGLYEVSNLGNVRNAKTKRILAKNLHHRGYYRVCLCKNHKQRYYRVHRLVAKAFIPNPNDYPVINHIDGNGLNNVVDNLEWCTQSHNVLVGKHREPIRNRKIKAFKKGELVTFVFENITQAEKYLINKGITKTKYPRTCIRDACDGKINSAYGFFWKYMEEK